MYVNSFYNFRRQKCD